MSCVKRKPAICICENKGANQLRRNSAADQCLCCHYLNCTIPLLPKFQTYSNLPRLYTQICVGPALKSSRDTAHIAKRFSGTVILRMNMIITIEQYNDK